MKLMEEEMARSSPKSTAEPWAPLIIAVAPNGGRRTKDDHPALPMSAREIADAAAACADAGAVLLHLHVRDRDGGHSLDAGAYGDAIAAVQEAAGERMIVQVTSESMGRYSPAEQMAMVRAVGPDAVSLAVRELVPDPAAAAEAAEFFSWLIETGILPQYILYTPSEVRRFADLCHHGVIPLSARNVLYVLGRYGGRVPSQPQALLPFLAAMSEADVAAASWSVCAFGLRESACALTAAALGGHIRVGFENNLHLSDGALAPDNAALVSQAAAGAGLIGRPLADARTARTILGA